MKPGLSLSVGPSSISVWAIGCSGPCFREFHHFSLYAVFSFSRFSRSTGGGASLPPRGLSVVRNVARIIVPRTKDGTKRCRGGGGGQVDEIANRGYVGYDFLAINAVASALEVSYPSRIYV